MSEFIDLNRRELLKTAAAFATAAAGSVVAPPAAEAQDQAADTLHFFPAGFKHDKVQTSGATINVVRGGEGPPLLLIHGAPQSQARQEAWAQSRNLLAGPVIPEAGPGRDARQTAAACCRLPAGGRLRATSPCRRAEAH